MTIQFHIRNHNFTYFQVIFVAFVLIACLYMVQSASVGHSVAGPEGFQFCLNRKMSYANSVCL